ncbi:hypothetical protein Nocox_01665 [Nonomuraea coxensis DSM 45129]|uniref:Uncharacterized protein n=1 Tax=Nonomuraea coxensis DSM 45129 TaxID=1122611 RepID=A0ABX8TTB3_9ACTN|nr:hypothetical protein Nocox_01665 [Nonomuraea coxensis DSM 45129]
MVEALRVGTWAARWGLRRVWLAAKAQEAAFWPVVGAFWPVVGAFWPVVGAFWRVGVCVRF